MVKRMETQTQIKWEQFEVEANASGGRFLSVKDGETYTIGVKSIEQASSIFERKQPDGSTKNVEVPQIFLVLDSVNGEEQKEKRVFPTGAKYLVGYIKSYHDSGLLYKFFFTLSRKGIGMATKYTLTPVKERTTTPKA
jgi:hypothetical protein